MFLSMSQDVEMMVCTACPSYTAVHSGCPARETVISAKRTHVLSHLHNSIACMFHPESLL